MTLPPVVDFGRADRDQAVVSVPNPTGLCMCGCGHPAPIARYHRLRDGIRKGQHCRFIKGHWARTQRKLSGSPANPSGLCMCGCGQATPLATRNRPGRSIVKGEPVRFCAGHDKRGPRPLPDDPGPNPSGLCMCGCGEKTSLAPSSAPKRGQVRGKPMRYLKGHDKRGKAFPPRGERLELIRISRHRRRAVVDEYRQGVPLLEIAERHGFQNVSSVAWAVSRAREEGDLIERRNAIPRERVDQSTIARLSKMWRAGATMSQMRAEFGWNRHQLASAINFARKYARVPSRTSRPLDLTKEELRLLKRTAAKTQARPIEDLSERKRTLLRLLDAAEKPLSAPALTETLCLLGWPTEPGANQSALQQLARRGLVGKVPVEDTTYRHAPRVLWYVPFDKEQSAVALTLDDARREAELSALLREQEADAARGHWAETDFKTFSLDADLGAEGGSWHDILVAGDGPFKAAVIER